MGQKPLVESVLADSERLIREFDQTENKLLLAIWYFYEDASEWKLLLASSAFDHLLPKKEPLAYENVSRLLSESKSNSLSISSIKIVRTDEALPKALSMLVGTDSNSINHIYFSDTTLNGIFIKEMIVLRSAIPPR